ncbi:MAG: hypoxanthine phosphoribosyltransferase [Luminiphilus sp.]|jgi:hypoxanthine phosphoribosyltransferase|nr:hypoxanthine phosphoribosyltransferase [Luminiphilus sp.]MBL6901679.1 hypoxanthine phosphoribosyltransferase [Luminiphilus sp.]
MDSMVKKTFVEEETLLNDAFCMAVSVYESGFAPTFIVGIWRGGSSVGIYVQECLQFLGVESDHISIRTSYAGLPGYQKSVDDPSSIRVHGLQYLLENLNTDDRLLLVDDVFNSGYSIEAVITELQQRLRLNMPTEIRVATPYFKPERNKTGRSPDYYVHEVDEWLVLPYEMQGLSRDEIINNKPSMAHILQELER